MVTDRGCEAGREHSQAEGRRRSDSCRTSRDRCNKHSSVEPIRPKGEESVDPVRSKESRGTCKASKGRRDESTGGMDYVEHHRQEGEIFGSMNHLGFLVFSGPSMTY